MGQQVKVQTILNEVITTGPGVTFEPLSVSRTFHLVGSTSSGTGLVNVLIEVSNDGENFVVFDTISMELSTTVNSEYGESNKPWKYVRGNIQEISGTDATVSLHLGNES